MHRGDFHSLSLLVFFKITILILILGYRPYHHFVEVVKELDAKLTKSKVNLEYNIINPCWKNDVLLMLIINKETGNY